LKSIQRPVVTGDRVYLAGRVSHPDSESVDSALLALDAADGTLLWQFTAPAGAVAAPARDDDTVYFRTRSVPRHVGDASPRRMGGLHAIDAATGQERWFFEIDWDVAPVVGANAVYVADRANVYQIGDDPDPPLPSYQVAGGSHRIREFALVDDALVFSVVHEVHSDPKLAILGG
jgi:outer membrane protein assembly factor BamB